MKTKIYTILLLALIISCAFILNSCSKYDPTCIKHTYTFTLSDDDKSKVPYTGTDTLVFISNTNDTIKCIGTGKVIAQNYKDAGGSPDCPPFTNTNCFENYTWNFPSSNNLLILNEQLFCAGENASSSHAYDFLINVNSNYSFYSFATCVSDPTCGNYLPNIVFNGRQYNKVTYLYRNFYDTTSKIYLNKSEGVIRIELNNKQQIWTLK